MDSTTNVVRRYEDRKKYLPKAAVSLTCAAVLAMGGVMAYLTSTDTATNKFELADSAAYTDAVVIEEPNWDTTDNNTDGIPDAAQGFLPNQSIAKDPQVHNTSSIDSYVMVTVSVPTENVVVGGAEAALTELFTYTVNTGWTEQGSGVYDAATGMTVHTYLYDSMLAAGATTPTVFDTVTLVDLDNGQVTSDNLIKDIVVNSTAIQAEGFDSATAAYTAMQNS